MNWSFSSLMVYESCPLRFKLAKIDRLPELPRPLDNPMERGNRIHTALEQYIKGETSALDCEAKAIEKLRTIYDHLRTLYAAGMVTVEQDWLFNRDWEMCERPEVWLWSKLDVCVLDETNKIAIPGDHKSGKSQYKAVEHVQQLQLYAGITALKYPWAETIIPELYYVDEGHVRKTSYTREQALQFIGRFDLRAQKIFDDKFYRPNPNKITCSFCPYGPKRGTGACPVGV